MEILIIILLLLIAVTILPPLLTFIISKIVRFINGLFKK